MFVTRDAAEVGTWLGQIFTGLTELGAVGSRRGQCATWPRCPQTLKSGLKMGPVSLYGVACETSRKGRCCSVGRVCPKTPRKGWVKAEGRRVC
jgi:hypothetical protein